MRTTARRGSRRRPHASARLGEIADLDREDEVVLREAADGVRPDGHVDAAVVHTEVGMMALALGELGHPVDEAHRTAEVGELEGAAELLLACVPSGQLAEEGGDL